jgi:anaerobic magnesium-protoporphyrin IX monomethyl ester cyclase
MKILLIRPFFYFHREDGIQGPTEPLALEYLASSVTKSHSVKILDATIGIKPPFCATVTFGDVVRMGLSNEELARQICTFEPEVIGISAHFFTQKVSVKEVVDIARSSAPTAHIVIGGNYASCLKDVFLKTHPGVDVLVYGEGEITFKTLCDNGFKNLESTKGIVYRNEKNEIVVNPPQPLIEDLGLLPVPDRDLAPPHYYQLMNAPFFVEIKLDLTRIMFGNLLTGLLRKNTIRIPQNNFLARILSITFVFYFIAGCISILTRHRVNLVSADIETSRGCPFNCVFCAVHNTWSRSFRYKKISDLRNELRDLVRRHRVTHINIIDDNFNIDKKRAFALCELFQELGIKSWEPSSGLYVMSLDQVLLTKMFESGCRHLNLIIESGCQRTLDTIIKKAIDITFAKEICTIAKSIGFATSANFIIGFPGETKADILETIRYAASLNVDNCHIHCATPLPGTELYKTCAENGYLPAEYDVTQNVLSYHMNFSRPLISTPEFGHEEIAAVRGLALDFIRSKGAWQEWEARFFSAFHCKPGNKAC